MEDYSQKINTKNLFVQVQAVDSMVSKLVTQGDEANISKSTEVATLFHSVKNGDSSECSCALTGLQLLAKDNVLPVAKLLSNLLADIVTAKSPAPIVNSISSLMILICATRDEEKPEIELKNRFTGPPDGPISPYVTLIRKKPDIADLVLEECGYLLSHPDDSVKGISVSMVTPLVIYSCCLSDTSCSSVVTPLVNLLVQTAIHNSSQRSQILDLLVTTAKLTRCSSKDETEKKLVLLNGIATLSLRTDNSSLQRALLPALICAVVPANVHNVSVRCIILHITKLVQRVECCDVSLTALALTLPKANASQLAILTKLSFRLSSHSSSNAIIGGLVLPSVIQILSKNWKVMPEVTDTAQALLALMQRKEASSSQDIDLKGNSYWSDISGIFPCLRCYVSLVSTSQHLCNSPPEVVTSWLTQCPTSLSEVQRCLVTSLFLHTSSTAETVIEAARVLEREVVKRRVDPLELLALLLYKLSHNRQPVVKLTIFHLLPSLATSKLCVSRILKIIHSFWSTKPLQPLLLRVTYDMWKVEPRVYPHLLKLIEMTKGSHDGDTAIAAAFIISEVCELKPSQHGEELLPILSSILNDNGSKAAVLYSSQGHKDAKVSAMISSALSKLALSAITSLIKACVIDLRATWTVIAPQLMKDKRQEVIVQLCHLLALSAKLQVKSEEYEAFTKSSLLIIWGWTTHQNKSVVEAAYKSLEDFNMIHFSLKMLPPYARAGIKLPKSLAATPVEAAKKPEDVLTYVPGEAWITLVREAKASTLPALQSFVDSLIKREVSGLHKGIYLTAVQEAKRHGIKDGEPNSYSFLKEYSTLKAVVEFLHNIEKEFKGCSNKEEGEKLLNTVYIFLKSLGQTLNRPYPALNWNLLTVVQSAVKSWCEKHSGQVDWNEKIKHSIFDVLSKQCNKSSSAASLMSAFLKPDSSNNLTKSDEIYLFAALDFLGRGIPPATLTPFLSYTFSKYINDSVQLQQMLIAVKPVLTSNFIHDANRNGIGNAIENLNEKIDPTNRTLYDSYKACVADLPSKHIERLTSPSLWWEVTDEKLFKAAVLRCHVAKNDPEESALPWLNDVIDSAASLPGERTLILKEVANTLTVRNEDKETTDWFMQLLSQLLAQSKKAVADNMVANHEHNQRFIFYTDLLVVSLVIWSGVYVQFGVVELLEKPNLLNELLPTAINILVERPEWKVTLPQFMNFLVYSYSNIQTTLSGRFDFLCPTLIMANLCPDMSQQTWNKVTQLYLKNSNAIKI